MKNIRLLNGQEFHEDKRGKTPAYFFNNTKHILDNNLIEELKLISRPDRKTMRICLHDSIDDILHNMIIIDYKNNLNLPHCHLSTSESHHILEGELGCYHFNDEGKLINSYVLSKNDKILDRIGKNVLHLLMPISDFVIYHESNKGLFNRDKPDLYIPKWYSNMSENEKNIFFRVTLSELP